MVSHCRFQSPGIDAKVNQTRKRRADQSIEGRYTRDVDAKNAAFARSAGSIAGYFSADDGRRRARPIDGGVDVSPESSSPPGKMITMDLEPLLTGSADVLGDDARC